MVWDILLYNFVYFQLIKHKGKMIKRKSSAFESMFKSKVLEEKAKPTRERKILFPHKYDDNAQETDSNYVIDIGAYRSN